MFRAVGKLALIAALCAACALISASAQSNLPRANSVIEPTAYVSLEPVPRGRPFDLAIVLNIRPGFHVNAHEASEDFLIPTAVTAELPAGFRTLAINYPQGELRKFSFSEKKLNVYEGRVTLRMKLEALNTAPLGAQKLAFKLRYQACTNEVCLPPVTVPVTAELQVAGPGAKTRPANADIFSAAQRSKNPSSKRGNPK
jgi:DsbC/DsbD-like thiol-disulfide interchange protein